MSDTSEPKLMVSSLRAKAVAQADAGDGQRSFNSIWQPKRKRAYHRALKRGEHWAIYKKTINDMINLCTQAVFQDMMKPNPLLKMIGLSKTIDSNKSK